MICYHCENAPECNVFRNLYSISEEFSINQCCKYKEPNANKYKKIAQDEYLLKLIYDYFTRQVIGYSEKEARQAITSAIWNL